MGVKLERIVKTYYDNLAAGKITARKCQDCGAVEWPPLLGCNTCGSTNMEWIEISGNAKLHSMVLPAPLSMKPEYKALGKYCYGEVELEEGARFNAVVRGINKKKRDEILAKNMLPVKCKAAIYQRDGYKTVVFDYVEEEE